jgi:uncharacterized protein YjbI with pentapeptide repeats
MDKIAADKQLARAEHEALWLSDWSEADYSWDGLGRQKILSNGKTLQDYWRRDPATGEDRTDAALASAGELVLSEGRWWHIAHLPRRHAAEASWKADLDHENWGALDRLVFARLVAAADVEAEGPAILDGATFRLPDYVSSPVKLLRLSCRGAWVICGGFLGHDFAEDANFAGATLDGDFLCEAVTFLGHVHFQRATFLGDADLGGATFLGDTSFAEASFHADASFFGACFQRRVDFMFATFHDSSTFESASFAEVYFTHTSFRSNVDFTSAVFSSRAKISGLFDAHVRFDDAVFEKSLIFSGAFARTAKSRFDNAVFKGTVKFSAVIEAPESSFRKAFFAARFLDTADFSRTLEGEGGRLAGAFVETQFEKALILADGSERAARGCFHARILADVLSAPASERDERLRELEAGCRTIKVAMGKARDELREQRYYRFQLGARQRRSDIDAGEKVLGAVYRATSDFGASLWRPIVGIVLATLFSGYLYAAWGQSLLTGRADVRVGRDYAFEGQGVALAALKPFSTLEAPRASLSGVLAQGGRPTLIAVLTANPAVTLGLRLATTFQVIVSTLFIFLFGLAVKRRFQIS